MAKPGKVFIVGAGPGDPELLTLKAVRCLQKADVILHDRLIPKEVLKQHAPQAKLIYVGKKASYHTLAQDKIEELLLQLSLQGKTVVRLKGGDPFIFGRGGEEVSFLKQHGVVCEIVPGISSALAVPLYAGIPLTHRDFASGFAVVTGHENPKKSGTIPYRAGEERKASQWVDWEKLAQMDTIVFLMSVGNARANMNELIRFGKDPQTPAAAIRWGSTAKQKTLVSDIAGLADKIEQSGFKAPAVIVVGGVVGLREKISWFENKALFAKRVLITRDALGNQELREALQNLGAQVLDWPLLSYKAIAIKKTELLKISTADWLLFSSRRGVEFFMEALKKHKLDARAFASARVAAVGQSTKQALKDHGIVADLVSKKQSLAGLASERVFTHSKNKKIILLGPKEGRTEFFDRHQDRHDLQQLFLYQTKTQGIPTDTIEAIESKGLDWIVFMSPSAVHGFEKHLGKKKSREWLDNAGVAVIGSSTAEELQSRFGKKPTVKAKSPSVESLVNGMCSRS
ncbi:MAG: uroporphyrinogen-III C-methyltransferase [Deltaproteobacteria bacterium]|nr:uroporphyrinogen-III C-methyltransferase [Deltaproteobacteria bacterium]